MLKTPEEIKKMFNDISKNYDFLNNIISFFTHKYIKTACIKLLQIKNGANVLDLCCGSGDICGIIKKNYPGSKVTGVDFSSSMLEMAKKKYNNINFIEADALKLPFLDNSFDYITISFGLRNIPNKDEALKEALRVLKPNGTFMHLDFGQKNFITRIYNFFVLCLIKILNLPEAYNYLIKSKEDFLTPDELIKKTTKNGFEFLNKKDFLFKNISCEIFKKPVV